MKTFKVIVLVTLIFVAGFAAGVVATQIGVRRFMQTAIARPELIRKNIEQDLDGKLRLDPRQRKQVHLILRDSHDRLRDLRQDFQPRFNAVMQETRTNIFAALTPEQQKSFEQFLADHRLFLPLRELPPPRTNAPR